MLPHQDDDLTVTFRFWNDVLDEPGVESMHATVVDADKGLFQLDNVPFFVKSFSAGDIVKAVETDGELLVQELAEASGNSTINLIFPGKTAAEPVLEHLTRLGCDWEGLGLIEGYYSVHVPAEIDYQPVYDFLKSLEERNALSFREACLAHNH